MKGFSFEDFFSIDSYLYKELFEGCSEIYEPLIRLASFLEKFPFTLAPDPIPSSVYIKSRETIFLGRGVIIEPGAMVQGPCIIGPDTLIRHGAYIRGNFICGNNCVIGHGTEVKNSIFLDEARAAHFSYVGDSIVGNRVNLGAGTILANLRFDKKMISIGRGGKKIETGLNKLGSILGDEVQVGCNTTLNPGTCMGKGTCTYPGLNLSGWYEKDSLIKNLQEIEIEKR